MADADDVRRLALRLPHVVEIDSDGFDFRVGDKGFVWSYPERKPGQRRVIRTDIAVLYVGDEAEKQALLLGGPGVFFTTPAFAGGSIQRSSALLLAATPSTSWCARSRPAIQPSSARTASANASGALDT